MMNHFTSPVHFLGARGRGLLLGVVGLFVLAGWPAKGQQESKDKTSSDRLNVTMSPVGADQSVKYDFDIVYVRSPRKGDDHSIAWTEVFSPLRAEPGSDLVLLRPDGKEEVLVTAGDDAVTDPFVSFDGQWVYYSLIHNEKRPGDGKLVAKSADVFRIHVKTRKTIRLTKQEFTPNTGIVKAGLKAPGVFNLGPCPLPGGRIIFTSNRNGLAPTKGYTPTSLQLFVMDDDGGNVELIGHLNVNSALHPTVLKDGRVMFTSYESQGLRDLRLWAIWTINPDGTGWAPLMSAFGPSGDTAYHFMTQLSDEKIVFEEYYNLNNQGFGTFYKMSATAPEGEPFFGPSGRQDARNLPYNGATHLRLPYTPRGLERLTTFVTAFDSAAPLSDRNDPKSPRVGKVTHPSAAPDNHLLAVWSPGPVNSNNGLKQPAIDAGLYLIKKGEAVREPGQMLLIKNDRQYNEQWPRALVPYRRIHGVDEPKHLAALKNDGKKSKHLPEGTPFGLVGTSSLYKRESYPGGVVPEGKVTADWAGGNDPFRGLGSLAYTGIAGNWFVQGSDTCRYDNGEIHAVRIVATEPTTDPRHTGHGTRRWWNAANERLRILGEVPVRKFGADGKQPTDPDGNPDTSFLIKLSADVPWTFQTLDRDGMVLNTAQTWHQLRPGEVRTDCGGCHAHSQKPTPFEETAAAKPDYQVFDLTKRVPLLTSKQDDPSEKTKDANGAVGLRFENGVKNVEYHRDVAPIFQRSCVACHTKRAESPAGNLILDDEELVPGPQSLGGLVNGPSGKVPGSYLRLALDSRGQFGNPSPVGNWSHPQASRYVRLFQARRSLLAWKVFGRRLDGFRNEDFVHEKIPGNPKSLVHNGKPFEGKGDYRRLINLSYDGSVMPPPEAVKAGKVKRLTDEDRRTLVRWIDLGCPIDLDFDPKAPARRGEGWMADDSRPTLTLTYPTVGQNAGLSRIVVGMHDHDSGINASTFTVKADFDVDGVKAGEDLASRFKEKPDGVRELRLTTAIKELKRGTLRVAVKDNQGNVTHIERTFSVGGAR